MARTTLRFRFRSPHAGLTLEGRGWRAQFEGGRFGTNDERVARGIVRRATDNPEYEIKPVRGSEKPTDDAATTETPAEGEGS